MYIIKNGNVKNVTRAIYKELYKSNGWTPMTEVPKAEPPKNNGYQPVFEDTVKPVYETNELEDSVDLRSMNYQGLLAYARQHNIKLGNVRQKDEIIELLERELNA